MESVFMTIATTPMMAQWHACKKECGDALLFFRLGDFYEAFYEDAEKMSKLAGLTLTARQGIPMCGVPYHTADAYIDKLIALGCKIAIAEQMEDPKSVKGIVQRKIVRTVTPGTLIHSQLLSEKRPNYFASLSQIGSLFGLALLDLSTADFSVFEFERLQDLIDELCRVRPAEFLISKRLSRSHPLLLKELSLHFSFLTNEKEDSFFDLELAQKSLESHFQIHSISSFGLQGQVSAISAAGSLVSHLKQQLNVPLEPVRTIRTEASSRYMALDRAALKNLELTESFSDESSKHTLWSLLDHTATAMGARALRHWIQHPLLSLSDIRERQDAIERFLVLPKEAKTVRAHLEGVRDLERLIIKIAARYATPRDLLALGLSIAKISSLRQDLAPFPIGSILCSLPDPSPLADQILGALSDSPPLRIGEGDIFRSGYNGELDQLRSLTRESTSWIARYQAQLREETNIKTLKVGFTKAFGYYIEVTHAQAEKIPSSFQRRQTLVGGERFITEELKLFEQKALTAEEKAKALEADLFEELRKRIALEAELIHAIAREIARVDALLSLTSVASEMRYVRPTIDESDILHIVKGRHPIIERSIGVSKFIPNDTFLDKEKQLFVITGPNMAGKSTYIRQVALIVILAQMGSFVPAESAHIGLIDKVFSRIGASDDIARGQSTFMVEMTETANILNSATSKSLVILDEIGRGTSTYDGISIAWAVAEFLLSTAGKQAKTLFATHYWELTRLEKELPGAVNYQVAVQETAEGIVFLRKIIAGGTDKSYGIHVAKLAGLPPKALKRAEEMLKELESKPLKGVLKKQPPQDQLFLFSSPSPESKVVKTIKEIDINQLTPLLALQTLADLQNLAMRET
ncbi:MAG: DNA mismatch repair protein MutS [Chlamydiae bacterium]|nr:DNA mismatch repair protein MutS [Chlamydiota bacterium]